MLKRNKLIELCKQVAEDTKNDATNFDGQPFTGKTVAQYFGNHGAAIAALANVIVKILDDNPQEIENVTPESILDNLFIQDLKDNPDDITTLDDIHDSSGYKISILAMKEYSRLQNKKLYDALEGIISIGKRDMSNRKYDGYFEEAKDILNANRS